MAFTAITYDIKPGCEDAIAAIFADFKRVTSSKVTDRTGTETGRVVATSLFIKNDTMVRFIEYTGDFDAVAEFMAHQPGVIEVEAKLKPYLAKPRNTGTSEGFVATFKNSVMRCVSRLPPEGN